VDHDDGQSGRRGDDDDDRGGAAVEVHSGGGGAAEVRGGAVVRGGGGGASVAEAADGGGDDGVLHLPNSVQNGFRTDDLRGVAVAFCGYFLNPFETDIFRLRTALVAY